MVLKGENLPLHNNVLVFLKGEILPAEQNSFYLNRFAITLNSYHPVGLDGWLIIIRAIPRVIQPID